jgi:protein phosphatase
MSRSEPSISCHQPDCDRPQNPIDREVCNNCGSPLTRRYLWAVGETAANKAPGSLLGGRYHVVEPQVWLDLTPNQQTYMPDTIPEELLPYLYLYKQKLHLPTLYGLFQDRHEDILLLENGPINAAGQPLPTLQSAWKSATALRQVYWLWQILQLWQPLQQWGLVGTLLEAEMIHVDDWRIRLPELLPSHPSIALSDLATIWQIWLPEARSAIIPPLEALTQAMQETDADIANISAQLNEILLQQAGQLPLRLQIHGGTDIGKERTHNEDSCYPVGGMAVTDDLGARLAIVCDGIGGHEGGEVASQMALRLILPQMQAFLTEVAQQTEIMAPELITEQLEALARVVNNVISSENDKQEREARRRMGTTLIMALQVPQRVKLPSGAISGNAHELYLLNVGDSRAYWITPRNCHQLNTDDDVATREVCMGRATLRDALERPDGGALIQALGTRDGEHLRPTVQRFIIDEDGLLLLCSDGLSDRDLVERFWAGSADAILRDRMGLEAAVQEWIDLANTHNGSDNISVVLTRAQVSVPRPEIPLTPQEELPAADLPEDLLEDDDDIDTALVVKRRSKLPWFLLLLGLGASGLFGWSKVDPEGFAKVQGQVQQQIQDWRGRIGR